MAKDLKLELDALETVSKSWINQVSPALNKAATSIDELKYSQLQFGPLFIGTWNAYTKAAEYIQARLKEAAPAATEIGTALHTAVSSFTQQQDDQAGKITKLEPADDSDIKHN
ncbi:type VII secretion target [Nocardia altamirensis]|uniref:type VII secretion target n=1 Tax=Nocardia altamirensis TaxID=472158 RepID=UPI00083FFED5|nr:type VII secretion target [Nocardia altamirensis]